ncbi:MAG: hypothetical protein ACRCT2_16900, partial [Plesiomonas shigelloides]
MPPPFPMRICGGIPVTKWLSVALVSGMRVKEDPLKSALPELNVSGRRGPSRHPIACATQAANRAFTLPGIDVNGSAVRSGDVR